MKAVVGKSEAGGTGSRERDGSEAHCYSMKG